MCKNLKQSHRESERIGGSDLCRDQRDRAHSEVNAMVCVRTLVDMPVQQFPFIR